MISRIRFRLIQNLLAFVSALVMAASFYFQYILMLEPCPLCIMQRMAVIALLFCSLLGMFFGSVSKAKWVLRFQLFFAASGIYFAGRQLWLQSLPPEALPACLPDLSILMKYFPLKDTLHALLWGAQDCAEKGWQFLGLTMPAWALFYFLFILILSGLCYWLLRKD